MKTIENKEITYVVKEPNERMTELIDVEKRTSYFNLIDESCNRPANPQAGFTYDEIKSIDRVKSVINAAMGPVRQFEDADYEFIKSRLEGRYWPSSSISIVEFVDYIKGIV